MPEGSWNVADRPWVLDSGPRSSLAPLLTAASATASQSGTSRCNIAALPLDRSGGSTSTSGSQIAHGISSSVLSGVMNDQSPSSRSRAPCSRTPYAMSRGA